MNTNAKMRFQTTLLVKFVSVLEINTARSTTTKYYTNTEVTEAGYFGAS